MIRRIRNLVNFLQIVSGQDHSDPSKVFRSYNVGKHTYGTPAILEWGEGATLRVGAFCSIAKEVSIFLGGEHHADWVTTFPFNVLWKSAEKIPGHPATKGDVVIGNDVWIGYGAVILSGATIGDGSIIGARAVVTRSVPPYAIVAGNPATIIRTRFDEKTIRRLINIQWWDWEDSKIEAYLPLMLQTDIESFLTRAEETIVSGKP
jgi:acetyltransferase-like isoleucine patch superfamily enzyme